MARFARLGAQQAQELGQNNTATCSTRPGDARACPGAQPRACRAAPSQTRARARTYKANWGLDRTPPLALNLAEAQDHRRSLCARRTSGRPRPDHHRPATLAIPPSCPTLEIASVCLGEASRARNRALPRRRHRINVAGLHPTTGARRPSSMVSLPSIPCTGSFLSTPWSSMCPWIELYRHEQAGAHTADEPARLRTWPDWFWPSPSTCRTSTWPPGPPGANPALRRTSLAAGKPRRPVYFRGYCFKEGRDLGEKEEEVGGFLNSQRLRWIVPQGHKLKTWFRKSPGVSV
jgi:hypothetical protein